MSLSLKIRNGDLALNGNSLDTVTGGEKLVQDLRCALLTPLGSYEPEPSYGSTLDDEAESNIIGTTDFNLAASLVRTEIARICKIYQKQQIHRNEVDGTTYGRLTLTPDETLMNVKDISFIAKEDKLIVKIEIETGLGEFQSITVPLEA